VLKNAGTGKVTSYEEQANNVHTLYSAIDGDSESGVKPFWTEVLQTDTYCTHRAASYRTVSKETVLKLLKVNFSKTNTNTPVSEKLSHNNYWSFTIPADHSKCAGCVPLFIENLAKYLSEKLPRYREYLSEKIPRYREYLSEKLPRYREYLSEKLHRYREFHCRLLQIKPLSVVLVPTINISAQPVPTVYIIQ
jgi:hypothetical protein